MINVQWYSVVSLINLQVSVSVDGKYFSTIVIIVRRQECPEQSWSLSPVSAPASLIISSVITIHLQSWGENNINVQTYISLFYFVQFIVSKHKLHIMISDIKFYFIIISIVTRIKSTSEVSDNEECICGIVSNEGNDYIVGEERHHILVNHHVWWYDVQEEKSPRLPSIPGMLDLFLDLKHFQNAEEH